MPKVRHKNLDSTEVGPTLALGHFHLVKMNGGRRFRLHSNTNNRTQRQKGDTPSKRGSSLPNYLDQTQSREFVDGRRREKVIWEIITEKYFNTFADLEGKS